MRIGLLVLAALSLSGCMTMKTTSCYITRPGHAYMVRVRTCQGLWMLDDWLRGNR